MDEAPERLVDRYGGLVCDLDGVVRRGSRAVPYAVEQLTALRRPVVYATNNASLTPEAVAEQLTGLGLPVRARDVVTSSQAGAAYLAHRFPPAAAVIAVGGDGVSAALDEVGLRAVHRFGADVVAVLQGYGPQVTALDLAEAAYAVQAGALWVATNRDATLPTDRGIAPGNGALLGAVATAAGTVPAASAGKPEPPLYDLSVERLGLPKERVLAVGDRLDTDILGAMAAGLASLWVLSGVDRFTALARAPGRPRPTYAAEDLRALTVSAPPVSPDGDGWVCDGTRLTVDWTSGAVRVRASGPAAGRAAVVSAGAAAIVSGRDERDAAPEVLEHLAAQLEELLSGTPSPVAVA